MCKKISGIKLCPLCNFVKGIPFCSRLYAIDGSPALSSADTLFNMRAKKHPTAKKSHRVLPY